LTNVLIFVVQFFVEPFDKNNFERPSRNLTNVFIFVVQFFVEPFDKKNFERPSSKSFFRVG